MLFGRVSSRASLSTFCVFSVGVIWVFAHPCCFRRGCCTLFACLFCLYVLQSGDRFLLFRSFLYCFAFLTFVCSFFSYLAPFPFDPCGRFLDFLFSFGRLLVCIVPHRFFIACAVFNCVSQRCFIVCYCPSCHVQTCRFADLMCGVRLFSPFLGGFFILLPRVRCFILTSLFFSFVISVLFAVLCSSCMCNC